MENKFIFSRQQVLKKQNELTGKKQRQFFYFKNISIKLVCYSILIFYTLISIWPFIWAFFASFKNPYLLSLTGLNPLPSEWTFENYSNLFTGSANKYVTLWIQNTIVYSLSGSLLNATLNLLGGYALAQIAMRGKRVVLSYFLVSILVPSQATFIPTYFIYSRLNIINDQIAPNFFIMILIFSGMANIVLTFMARQFFLTQTKEIEEAAKMEGYGALSVFFKITLRKMLPLFATQFVMVFMGSWNNFLAFQLFSAGDPNKMTLNAGVVSLYSSALDKERGYGQALAMSNISFVPMFIIYIISLRIQLRGIRGGNK